MTTGADDAESPTEVAAAIESLREQRSTGVSRLAILVGLLVVLAGVGVGAWLLLDDDGVSTDDAREAGELVDEGLQLHVGGDLDGAARKYRSAIDLDESNKLAHYNLGLILQLQGETAEAEAEYRTTLKLDAAYAPALYNLAVLVAAEGNAREATSLYEQAIDARPDFADAMFNLGLLKVAQGDLNGGNKLLAEATRLNPRLASRVPGATTSTTTTARDSEP